MNAGTAPRGTFWSWLICGAIAISAHAGVLIAFAQHTEPAVEADAGAAIVIEFAEEQVAAANIPLSIPPGPEQIASDAKPQPQKLDEEEKTEQPEPEPVKAPEPMPKDEQPDPEIPVKEEPKKEEQAAKETPLPPAPTTSAPQVVAEKTAPVAAAPKQGAPSRATSASLPGWMAKVSAQLERNKRYPENARAARQDGVVLVSFRINRQGELLARQIKRSSGRPSLDEEALRLLDRAQPFPALPADMPGAQVSLTVPIRFDIR